MTFLPLPVKDGIDLEREPRHHDHDDDDQTSNNPAQGLLSIEPI